MSSGRFASMTASLLARKGDAQPSAMPDGVRATQGPSAWISPAVLVHRRFENKSFSVPPTDMRTTESGAHAPDLRVRSGGRKVREVKVEEPVQIDKPRRLFVNLTPAEYERLGIVAVKRDSTRHHLLREAFETFLEKASQDYGSECACVGGACKGACEP